MSKRPWLNSEPKPQTHTPTPWSTDVSFDIYGSHGECIANIRDMELPARANADFIVRSTNNFEKMLETLKLIRQIADQSIAENPALITYLPEIRAMADKAISEALQ